jgi:uncharacterized protein (TIGR00255 family)
MVKSMTGAAALAAAVQLSDGAPAPHAAWDLRAVNGRNLDLRLRLPEGLDGLEAGVRARLSAVARRGSISLGLRLTRLDEAAPLRLDPAALAAALVAVAQVQTAAEEAGVALRPPTAAEVLGLRGVLVAAPEAGPPEPLVAALLAQADDLIARFDAVRRAEGAALAKILAAQIDRIEALLAEARALLPERAADQAATLRAGVERLLGTGAPADPERLAQELALLAVRSDVAEELDRLAAHVAAARRLLTQPEPAGRPLDFLTQEFNREANTLCAKAQHAGLSRIGLDLKTVIDQMREQVQNLE